MRATTRLVPNLIQQSRAEPRQRRPRVQTGLMIQVHLDLNNYEPQPRNMLPVILFLHIPTTMTCTYVLPRENSFETPHETRSCAHRESRPADLRPT